MRRREFITLFVGATAAWSLEARAQPDRIRRVGVLMGQTETEPMRLTFAAFVRRLNELGWKEGRNLRNTGCSLGL